MGGVRNSKDKAAEAATAEENHKLMAVGLVAKLLRSLGAAPQTRASADVQTQRAERGGRTPLAIQGRTPPGYFEGAGSFGKDGDPLRDTFWRADSGRHLCKSVS